MNIINTTSPSPTKLTFKDLKPGDVFYQSSSGNLEDALRKKHIYMSMYGTRAVNLSTGLVLDRPWETEVAFLDAELHVSEPKP